MKRRDLALGLLLAIATTTTASAAAAPLTMTGQERTVAVSCAGHPAAIKGSSNHVTIVGPCPSLRIEGDHNVVSVELARAGTVRITGNYNQVIYAPSAPPPVTTLFGYYNEVAPAPAGTTGTTMVLDGALGRRDLACDGLDVVILESQARYALRGGCRSITVQGHGDIIVAELLPSARLVFAGTDVVVNYVLIGQGAPPSVLVTAPGASATHIARFGESALMLRAGTGMQ